MEKKTRKVILNRTYIRPDNSHFTPVKRIQGKVKKTVRWREREVYEESRYEDAEGQRHRKSFITSKCKLKYKMSK